MSKKLIICLIVVAALLIGGGVTAWILLSGGEEPEGCTHAVTTVTGAKTATCSAAGYTGDEVCTACTQIVKQGTEIAKLAHTYDAGRVTKNPTCIETGVTTFTCTGCGAVQTEPIATVAHNDVYHDAQDGNHFTTCVDCCTSGKSAHNPTDAGVAVAASCTEAAYVKYVCADCQGVYKVYSETDLALDHDLGDWVITEATCVDDGAKVQKCEREGCDFENKIVIPALVTVHNMEFVFVDTPATCIDAGESYYECVDCGQGEYRFVAATGIHDYQPLADTGDGWVRKECLHCEDIIATYDASTLKEASLNAADINTDNSLGMNMQDAAIQFPKDVVSQIAGGTDLSISAGTLDDTAKEEAIASVEDEALKEALQNAPIFDFTVKVDNEPFAANFNSKVAVTVSYDNGDEDADGIVIYYVGASGEVQAITDVVYDAEKKEVTFFVEHFSYYAVAYQETQAMRCKRGLHNYEYNGISAEATCYSFGYKMYECTSCHRTTVDDIVARPPHNFGEIIPAAPTCDQGDWSTQICQNEGCGSVNYIKFEGATGHAMDKPATCTTPSRCTKCNDILVRALGHSFTEWETVVEATEINNGIKRRYCLICGEVEETKIAATGTIEAIEFNDYMELLDLILGEALGVDSGEISFAFENPQDRVDLTAKIMKLERGYRMVITGKSEDLRYEEVNIYEAYYDNGVFVFMNKDEDGDGYASASELENLIPAPIEVMKDMLEQLHGLLDDYVRGYLAEARAFLDEYSELLGDDINAALAAAEIPYTVDQLGEVLDAIETVYAYLSLKLGYSTSQEIIEGVALPTKEDFRTVLGAILAVKQEAGVTTYYVGKSAVMDAIEETSSVLEDSLDQTIADLFWDAFGAAIAEADPTITDFDALVAFIKRELPGTLTVMDALDKYVALSEENDWMPDLDSLYAIIDEKIAEISGEEISSKDIVDEYAELSLNALLEAYGVSMTAEEFYDYIAADLKEYTLADLYVGEITVGELYERIDYALGLLVDPECDFSLSFDKNGNIVALSANVNIALQMGEEVMTGLEFRLSIVRDASTKVEIPAAIAPAMKDVTAVYDKDGNLVISGLPEDTTVDISGSAEMSFSTVLEKDTALSEAYGKDVYVLKRPYWTNSSMLGSYYLIDGKYYTDSGSNHIWYYDAMESLAIDSFLENASDYFRVDGENALGYIEGRDGVMLYPLVYTGDQFEYFYGSKGIAAAFMDGDTWMVATQYGYVENSDGYYVHGIETMDAFFENLKVESSKAYSTNYYVEVEGQYLKAMTINLSYGVSGRTVQVYGYEKDGELYVYLDGYGDYGRSTVRMDQYVTTLPAHDYQSEWETEIVLVDEVTGDITVAKVDRVYIYNYVPSYYVEVADGVYTAFDSDYLLSTYDKSAAIDTMELPDGNTLYIVGETMDNHYGYTYGYKTVYGYTETVSGFFVQTAVIVDEANDSIIDLMYRDARSQRYFNFSDLYDIEDYLTVSNGVYTISAELINILKNACGENDGYYFILSANEEIDGVEFMFRYCVGAYVNFLSIEDAMGSASAEPALNWEELFGYGGSSSMDYTVVYDADTDSITLIFGNGFEIKELRYDVNLPIDDLLEKNTVLSNQTGLDIYTYYGSRKEYHNKSFLNINGKYYDYTTEYKSDYEASAKEITTITAEGWQIMDMAYRFDMIAGGDLPAALSVYETDVRLPWLGWFISNPTLTLYTFYLDGELQVAVEAEQTGESLLTFESYMPLDEYMAGLTFVVNYANAYKYSTAVYHGTVTDVYRVYLRVYEPGADVTDEEAYKTEVEMLYLISGGKKMMITDAVYNYKYNVIRGDEADLSDLPDNATWYFYSNEAYNGTFNFVSYSWYESEAYERNFISLAGRYYRYDCEKGYWCSTCFQNQKIDEWSFQNMALDKVWYYVVEDDDGNLTFYTEFIPSDAGFAPAGDVVDPDTIDGWCYGETLLGYTADGDPLYEYAYYINEDSESFTYTAETQDDGTIFYHRNGAGYLRVESDDGPYYVRARKVTNQDGSTQIYCFLGTAMLSSTDVEEDASGVMNQFVTVDGNEVTISRDFLEIAAYGDYDRDVLWLRVYYGEKDGYYTTVYFDYYRLAALFQMG